MQTFKPKQAFEVAARTRFASSTESVVALGGDGVLRVLDPERGAQRALAALESGREVSALTVSPDGKLAAFVVEHERVVVVDLARDAELRTIEGPFRSALFIDDATLWTVASPDEQSCEWRSFALTASTAAGKAANKAAAGVRFDDPVGASGVALFRHPTSRAMLVYLGGGQDGQLVYVAQEFARRREVFELLAASDGYGHPVLHPSGDELIIPVEGGFTRYALPSVEPLQHVRHDVAFAYVEYGASDRVLALDDDGELLVFDLASGEQGVQARVELAGVPSVLRRHDARLMLSLHAPRTGRRSPSDGAVLAVWEQPFAARATGAKSKAAAAGKSTRKPTPRSARKPTGKSASKPVAAPAKKPAVTDQYRPRAPLTPAVQALRARFAAVIDRYGEQAFAALTVQHHSTVTMHFKPPAVLAQAIRDGYTWPTYETISVLRRAGERDTARALALAVIECSDLHADESIVMQSLRELIDLGDEDSLRLALPLGFRPWSHPHGNVLAPETSRCPTRLRVIVEFLEQHGPFSAEPRTWPKLDEADVRAARAREDPWVVIVGPAVLHEGELRARTVYNLFAEADAAYKVRLTALARKLFERAGDEHDRRGAAEALVRIEDYEPLLACLDDKDPNVRGRAVRALVRKDKGPGFARAFEDCDYDVRLAAVREMMYVDPGWLYERMSPVIAGGKVAAEDVLTVQVLMHGLASTSFRAVPISWRSDEPRWKRFAQAVAKAKVHGTREFLVKLRSYIR